MIIRFELGGVLDGTPGRCAPALVGSEVDGRIDGDDTNPIYVWDAWGKFHGRPGEPGRRGDVGYAVWMADKQRFEVLSLL